MNNTGSTNPRIQGRIKVFWGPGLETVMGPYPFMVPVPTGVQGNVGNYEICKCT